MMRKRFKWVGLLLWRWWVIGIGLVQAQSPITFTATETDNQFPQGMIFETAVSSSAGEITSAKFIFTNQDNNNRSQIILEEIEPASDLTLTYEWDTSDVTIVPSQPVYYFWEVTDSAGNRASSPIELVRYDDIRFEWQVREDENIAVWWHDQPTEFGEQVFAIASQAAAQQRALFQVDLDFQMRVIIYNDFDEFAEWHSFVSEFIGGQAFPVSGVTTQIVPQSEFQGEWLLDVLPHEIAHLFFYQASRSRLSIPPSWLNEGVAQYLELTDNALSLRLAQLAVLAGDRIPLWSLTGSFGFDEDNVRLAYAEALSAVTYLIETYGESGLADLLAAYQDGQSDAAAFETALGVTPLEFEYEWLAWLGAPADLYPTPTLVPTRPPIPTPPMMVTPTRLPTQTPTPTSSPMVVAVVSPSPTETPIPPTAVPSETAVLPTLIPTESPAAPAPASTAANWQRLLIMGLGALFVGGIVMVWYRRR